MKTIAVIGAGPAGLMSAIIAKSYGADVVLFEKNDKIGKKLFITGKGRCNLTNNTDVLTVIKNVVNNPKFAYSALNAFSPEDVISFFESNGLSLKTERGNRVFPTSDKSSDVIKCFQRILDSYGVDIRLNTTVLEILKGKRKNFFVKTNKSSYEFDAIIIATGGISYPLTGSTGDGYIFAKNFNHKIVSPVPALCGIETNEIITKKLPVDLKNVGFTVINKGKQLYYELGEITLDLYGLSGPMAISASSLVNRLDFKDIELIIDLKPALSSEKLNTRILREINENGYITVEQLLIKLTPSIVAYYVGKNANLPLDKKIARLSTLEREKIVFALKNLKFSIKKLRKIDEAIVTSGGIETTEINPKTMESKLIENLYFAGEVIDIDAFTGGFNIQLALSTGYSAGYYSANKE